MPKTFRVGDHVRWNSEARRVSGVLKKIASDTKVEGYVHHASQEAPQYLNKSDKTVHVAIRKGNAPRLISSPATNLSKTKETTSRGIYEIAEINTRKQIEVCTKAFCSRRARGDIHLQANLGYDGHEGELGALGFESATLDHMFRLTYARGIPGSRTPYGPAALNTIRVWKEGAAKVTVPYFADCPVGWDDSAGYGSSLAMVTQRSPEQYQRLLRATQYFSAQSPARSNVIFLSPWNEWTEDHVLLPDTVFGYIAISMPSGALLEASSITRPAMQRQTWCSCLITKVFLNMWPAKGGR